MRASPERRRCSASDDQKSISAEGKLFVGPRKSSELKTWHRERSRPRVPLSGLSMPDRFTAAAAAALRALVGAMVG
jgi:hypothetical protein